MTNSPKYQAYLDAHNHALAVLADDRAKYAAAIEAGLVSSDSLVLPDTPELIAAREQERKAWLEYLAEAYPEHHEALAGVC